MEKSFYFACIRVRVLGANPGTSEVAGEFVKSQRDGQTLLACHFAIHFGLSFDCFDRLHASVAVLVGIG